MGDKETRILEASYQLFVRHGYRKVTMSDIAEAAELSRPTVYAAFANKEAVFGALVRSQMDEKEIETRKRLERLRTLKSRLETIFDIWIIRPVTSLIDSETTKDLRMNSAMYAPDAVAALYGRLEVLLTETLEPAMQNKRQLAARDLARILTLAAKALKATTDSAREIERMASRLVAMAVVVVENG
jgi:AcrR family transcriptional regulator